MFRNREIKLFALIDVLILMCFLIVLDLSSNSIVVSPITITISLWLLLNLAFFLLLHYRYRTISKLAFEIDKVLHSNKASNVHYLDEGELNILGSEINKMLLRINEQNKELENDKLYLVNSLADISHQLKTPLTSLQLTNTLLLSNAPDDMQDHLITEKKLLTKVQWLIDVILKISKLDANAVTMSLKPHNLNDLINYTLEPLSLLIDIKNITIIKDIESNTTITCDFKWISEALTNIIKNCIEHTYDNGTITIKAIDTPLFLELNIADNGKGFLAKDIPHLFERFYKGENSSKDSIGIGLALAKSIINNHNGIITAYNVIDNKTPHNSYNKIRPNFSTDTNAATNCYTSNFNVINSDTDIDSNVCNYTDTTAKVKGACFSIKFYKLTI